MGSADILMMSKARAASCRICPKARKDYMATGIREGAFGPKCSWFIYKMRQIIVKQFAGMLLLIVND
jgi:hypothetical protein